MTINDRRGAATMTHRRNFLIGIASLIAAPAVVKAETLMPILVWRPTFYRTGGHHGWSYMLASNQRDLIGVDLNWLGLPPPSRSIGCGDREAWVWNYARHPLESLPQNRIRIAPGPRNAALAAASTNHRIGGLALARGSEPVVPT
jgi:hypothetical protein